MICISSNYHYRPSTTRLHFGALFGHQRLEMLLYCLSLYLLLKNGGLHPAVVVHVGYQPHGYSLQRKRLQKQGERLLLDRQPVHVPGRGLLRLRQAAARPRSPVTPTPRR